MKIYFLRLLVIKGGRKMTNEMFRAIRLYKNMNQIEFARFIGVSLATVGRIETGSLELTPKVKAKLADRFEFNGEFFSFFENYLKIF